MRPSFGLSLAAALLPICLAAPLQAQPVDRPVQEELPDPAILQQGPIGRIGLGLGYGTETGLAFSAYARADGLVGEGQQLGVNLLAGQDGGSLDIDYLRASVGGRDDLSFGLSVNGTISRPTEDFAFRTEAVEISPRLTWQASDSFLISPYLSLSTGRISDVAPDSSALIRNDANRRNTAAVGVELRRLFGDDSSSARTLLQSALEFGHGDNGHSYAALSFDLRHERPLSDSMLFSAALSAGTLHSFSGVSHIGDRTILGQSSLRGFDFGGIGPRDRAVEGSPALGGNNYATLRLELRAPRAFTRADRPEDSAGPVPGIFLDAGSLWGLDDTRGGPTGLNAVDDGFHLRASTGLMLDFETRLGTFQISLAHAVRKLDYDRTAPFSLSYSLSF